MGWEPAAQRVASLKRGRARLFPTAAQTSTPRRLSSSCSAHVVRPAGRHTRALSATKGGATAHTVVEQQRRALAREPDCLHGPGAHSALTVDSSTQLQLPLTRRTFPLAVTAHSISPPPKSGFDGLLPVHDIEVRSPTPADLAVETQLRAYGGNCAHHQIYEHG